METRSFFAGNAMMMVLDGHGDRGAYHVQKGGGRIFQLAFDIGLNRVVQNGVGDEAAYGHDKNEERGVVQKQFISDTKSF
jgi:hypothetical protein